jgi:hypothetical protein
VKTAVEPLIDFQGFIKAKAKVIPDFKIEKSF